jgi:hypothetical protein
MAFTVPTFTKLKIVEQIRLQIFCIEICPDRLGKVKVRLQIYVRSVSIKWLPIVPFSWKYCFFQWFKKTTTRKYYEYRTDNSVVGSTPQIDAEGRDIYKTFFSLCK